MKRYVTVTDKYGEEESLAIEADSTVEIVRSDNNEDYPSTEVTAEYAHGQLTSLCTSQARVHYKNGNLSQMYTHCRTNSDDDTIEADISFTQDGTLERVQTVRADDTAQVQVLYDDGQLVAITSMRHVALFGPEMFRAIETALTYIDGHLDTIFTTREDGGARAVIKMEEGALSAIQSCTRDGKAEAGVLYQNDKPQRFIKNHTQEAEEKQNDKKE